MKRFTNVFESKHPVLKAQLSVARNKNSNPPIFRKSIEKITNILAIESTQNLSLIEEEIETPLTKTTGCRTNQKIAVVPVLRAGLGMCSAFMEVVDDASIWYLGMYRNEETLQPVSYYNKLPKDSPPDMCYILDPMLATGGTLNAVVQEVKNWGATEISVVSVIAAPEGIQFIQKDHPEIKIFVGEIDEKLTKDHEKWPDGYIWPGLGDAGDRLSNTLD